MVNTYTVLKSAHVLAAVTWVGSNIATQVYALRAQSAGPARLAPLTKDIAWYGNFVLAPASLVLIVSGFGMVADADYSLGDAWLSIGLAVWIVSFIDGAFYLGPTSKKIGEAIDGAGGATVPASARALLDRVFLLSRIELLLLIAVVVVMVIKPGA